MYNQQFNNKNDGEPIVQNSNITSASKNNIWKIIIPISIILIFLIVLYALMRIFVFDFFVVSGLSMEPTFEKNEWVLLKKYDTDYKRGDMVVFKDPQFKESSFKRIIGLPGEKIKILGNFVFINNKELDENCYLSVGTETLGDIDLTLREGEYFVLGDNRGSSLDSRILGAITKESIIGKYWLSLFNFKNENKLDKCVFLSFVSPEKRCIDNGGKFEVQNESDFCVFDGKQCGEFGYNKCVASKGEWQPTDYLVPGSDVILLDETYTNEKYGFTVDYPKDWNFSSGDITNPSNPGYEILIKNENGSKESVRISITANYPALQEFNASAPLSQKLIGGVKAREEIFSNGWCDVTDCTDPLIGLWANNKGYIYTFDFSNTKTISGIYNQILSTFKFTNKMLEFCESPLIPADIGYYVLPVNPKYGNLNWLGQIFTAYDCGPERVDAIFGVDEGMFGIGLGVMLKNDPDRQLINVFNLLGFYCADNNNSVEKCRRWEIENSIKIDDLMKLEPYYNSFQWDDCIMCG